MKNETHEQRRARLARPARNGLLRADMLAVLDKLFSMPGVAAMMPRTDVSAIEHELDDLWRRLDQYENARGPDGSVADRLNELEQELLMPESIGNPAEAAQKILAATRQLLVDYDAEFQRGVENRRKNRLERHQLMEQLRTIRQQCNQGGVERCRLDEVLGAQDDE